MRVLVTWGSKLGGTAGIAEDIVDTLRAAGHEIVARDVRDAPSPEGFHAAIIGAAVAEGRWVPMARHYVEHHVRELRRIPTWLFSTTSGGLESPHEIRGLVAAVGAIDDVSFDETRDHALVRGWAAGIGQVLPDARPRPGTRLHGHAFSRVLEYGAAGWAILAVCSLALLGITSVPFSVFARILLAPIVFGMLARRYQNADGARAPLSTAITWTIMVAAFDSVLLEGVVKQQIALTHSVPGFWIPLLLIFAASWAVGAVSALYPMTRRPVAA